jgi:capsular polysaccharide biosynthesis protein
MYESWTGNRWFGCWLAEDCLAYPLAEAFGTPIATPVNAGWGHMPAYNARLGVAPRQMDAAHFDELIVFDDMSSNAGRAKRAQEMRDKLILGCDGVPVPGVFLLRGKTGDLRLMANESEIAQRLATEYGFLILDPATASLDELAAVCSQARVIAGVEGSHLVHGAVMMPPDATLFVIQPPTRATAFLKGLTDLRGQRFAFVVADGGVDAFTCDWTDIQRTLDLALAA